MSKRLNSQSQSEYGFPQPVTNLFPTPISARRSPTASDTGYIIGQVWVNRLAGTVWALASNAGGAATWLSLGGSLTPAVVSLTTGAAATSTLLAGDTWSATGSNAAISLTLTPKGVGNVIVTSGDVHASNGNLTLNTAGKGIQIKEGANARMGQATLVGGTIAVADTSVTANTRIFLSRDNTGGVPGALGDLVVVPNVGVGFTINSTLRTDGTTLVVTDVSVVNWLLIEAL
jgi:hypothetical protein